MFGRRKRTIHREGDDLKQRLENLETQAEQLHAEIKALEAEKNDPYSRLISTPLHGPDLYLPSPVVRRLQRPTRSQHRRKRNLAVALIVAAVIVLIWIAAKIWRYVG
jgi:hypothetical protein